MKKKNNFKKGSVEILILHLLQSVGESYGYELSVLIKERSNDIITIPEGSMYPTLYRLVDEGYIQDTKKRIGKRLTRVYYKIEDKGKEHLQKILGEYYKTNEGIQNVLNYEEK